MIKVIWFLALTSLGFSAPDEIVKAYYLGKQSPENWQYHFRNDQNQDPFTATEGQLKAPPFESRFFRQGDELWDFQKLTGLGQNWDDLTDLTYNRTTGRVVVRGAPSAHRKFGSIYHYEVKEVPIFIEISVELFEKKSDLSPLLHDWSPTLDETWKQVGTIAALLKNGAQGEFFYEEGLSLYCEPNQHSSSLYTDLRLNLAWRKQGHQFQLSTGILFYASAPLVIDLGKVGIDQARYALRLHGTLFLDGEIPIHDGVLDANGEGLPPSATLETRLAHTSEPSDEKTGTLTRSFSVPPSFLSFLTDGELAGDIVEGDPFADDDDPFADNRHQKQILDRLQELIIHDCPPEIPAPPGDAVYDLKKFMEAKGISVREGDYVLLLARYSTIFARLSTVNMELLEAIAGPCCGGVHRPLISVRATLIESSEKLSIPLTSPANTRSIASGTILMKPGQMSSLNMNHNTLKYHCEFEPTLGGNHEKIDLRLKTEMKNGERSLFKCETGTTLFAGTPQILTAREVDGKWQSLVVSASVVDADFLLRGK